MYHQQSFMNVIGAALIVVVVVLALAVAAAPASSSTPSSIVVANSVVGRLSGPTQTRTVAFPTPNDILEVLDAQGEGQQFTIVTESLVVQWEEFSVSRRGAGRRNGKRGVVSIMDTTTDEPYAAFEYFVDRDEVDGALVEGEAPVYASPPTAGGSKSKANPVIGTVRCTIEESSERVAYSMKFSMDEHHDAFPANAVIVVKSTEAGQRARLEEDAKASSSYFSRWMSPIVLFVGLYALLYAFSYWKASSPSAATETETKKEI
jgi:hypothetical protein